MKVSFDCGRHGVVTWELPEQLTDDEQRAAEVIQRICQPQVSRFFKLLVAIMLSGSSNVDEGLKEVDEAITNLATNGYLRGRGTN